MTDVDRRRFLAALGLAPAAMLLLTGCPGGEGDNGEDDEDSGEGENGGEDDD